MRAHLVPVAVAFTGAIALWDLVFPTAVPVGDRHVVTYAATVVDLRPVDGTTVATVHLRDGTLASFASPAQVATGERLTLRAEREPFDGARNPGEPSQRDLEAERGVTWRLVHARVLARAPPDDADAMLWIARARAWASERLHATVSEPAATILAGALWGERGPLSPELKAEFQDTGTVHVLVTAGLHLGVVAALGIALLSWSGVGRIGSSLAAIALVWAYAAFSGGHLPSLRAATMLSFALLARACGREAYSWNALAAAAIVVALMRPQAVASLSFALSFSCVAAIFAFARPCTAAFERLGCTKAFAELFGVSCATQIGTWPLTAYAFLVVAPYAPVANAAVVPLVGVAMLAGLASLAASPVPMAAQACANVAGNVVDAIAGIVHLVASLPGARIVATPPPVWTIVAYDIAAAFAAITIARRRTALGAALLAGACALCLWPPRAVTHDLVITAIDVGQADALLVQTPSGHAFLIDGGGRLERGATSGASGAEAVGERIVVPLLVRAGIHHLDAVLLSHPHGDHAGGIAPVLRALGANEFADSGQAYRGHAYHDALDIAHARGIPIVTPRAGDIWHTDDGVTLRFYGPMQPFITGSRNDINNNSLVFRLEYGTFRMLFTGDAGAETEARLLASGVDLSADVLKVGHHGSAYGTTPAFVHAVHPRAAVISVGRHNLFGHPAPETLATLVGAGATVYRTDLCGAVVVQSDGRDARVASFLPACDPRAAGGLE